MKLSEWSRTDVYSRTIKTEPMGWIQLRVDPSHIMWEVVLVKFEPVARGTVFRDRSRARDMAKAEREALAAYARLAAQLAAEVSS